jgi:hypothetical protein
MYSGLARTLLAGRRAGGIPDVPAGGLELHLDGDFVTYGATATATDLSGNSRDCIQSTAGNQPSPGTSLNGHATVTHDGGNDRLIGDFGSPGLVVANVTVVTLTKRPATSSNRGIFDSSTGTVDSTAPTNTGIMMLQEGNSRIFRDVNSGSGNNAQYTFADANWAVHIGTRDHSDGLARIYEGSTLKATGTLSQPTPTLRRIRIGMLFQDAYPWDGDWAEILYYSRLWDASDITQYLSHVNTKYGLSLT